MVPICKIVSLDRKININILKDTVKFYKYNYGSDIKNNCI